MSPSRASTIGLAIAACLLWSTAFVGIKIGLIHSTPLNFAGVRFFFAGLLLFPFLGNPVSSLKVVGRHLGFVLKVAFLYTVLLYSCFYLGISLGSASTTAIVVGGGPLFISLMAHFLMPDDRFTPRKVVSLVIGMTGIVVIALHRYNLDLEQAGAFWSVLLLVAANIFGGFGNIIIAKSRRDISPLLLNSAQLVIGGAVLYLISLIVEAPVAAVRPVTYYGALFYLSALSAVAITIWFGLLQRPGVKVSELNLWKFLIPVFGALLSWTLLDDDRPDAPSIVGMCCIAVSLVLINVTPGGRVSGSASGR